MITRFTDFVGRVDRKYALGALLGIVGTILSMVGLREKQAAINVDIQIEQNVLDVNARLEDVQVTYKGQDIAQQRLNLRILQLRIENSGDVDILQSAYDRDDVFGIRIGGGRIVEQPRVSAASSLYLREKLLPRVAGSDTLVLNKVILDRGAYAVLEIRVLHPLDRLPTVHPIGKVAGIQEISTTRSAANRGKPGLISTAFAGGFWVQALRVVVYALAAVITLIVAFIPVLGFSLVIDDVRLRRWRRIADPLIWEVVKSPGLRSVLQELVRDVNADGLVDLSFALQDESARRRYLAWYDEHRRDGISSSVAIERLYLAGTDPTGKRPTFLSAKAMETLLRSPYARRADDGDLLVDKDLLDAMRGVAIQFVQRGFSEGGLHLRGSPLPPRNRNK